MAAMNETPDQNELDAAIALATRMLGDTLGLGLKLIGRCADLAEGPAAQSLPAVLAAARLINGQSAAAATLALVARGETRHRSIVERADLNSDFDAPPRMTDEELRASLAARLDRLLTPEQRARERLEDDEGGGSQA